MKKEGLKIKKEIKKERRKGKKKKRKERNKERKKGEKARKKGRKKRTGFHRTIQLSQTSFPFLSTNQNPQFSHVHLPSQICFPISDLDG
jgi:hypothetical protein